MWKPIYRNKDISTYLIVYHIIPLFDENNELLQEELKKEQEKARQQQIDNVVYSSWELINKIDAEKVTKWIQNGAQPTDTVRDLLKKENIIK